MRAARRQGAVLGLCLAATFATGTAPATAAVAPDPGFVQQAAVLYARSQQKGSDQLSNPEYLRRVALLQDNQAEITLDPSVTDHRAEVDPFRLDWGASGRGHERDVEIRNRYGARLHGHLMWPRDEQRGPYPAVVVLGGQNVGEYQVRGLAQGLAEAGYVVLGLSAQSDPGSQYGWPDPDPSTPGNEHPMCRPGPWQQPQEMGIREQGPCAGADVEPGDPTGFPRLLVSTVVEGRPDPATVQEAYEVDKARKTFAALDAVAWLLDPARNPVARLVDASRVGVAGHSLGAHAALLAGNGDPQGRFSAVVSWDGHGRMGSTTTPRVPTLFLHGDLHDFGPQRQRPAFLLPGQQEAERFRRDGVPTGAVVLGGTTHQEFNYLPFPLSQTPVAGSSRDGERVALHYTLAWFDRFLGSGPQRGTAARRLTAATFDGSADASSIGQGTWDPVGQRNVPPTIAGLRVADRLSPWFRSWVDAPAARCADLVAGC